MASTTSKRRSGISTSNRTRPSSMAHQAAESGYNRCWCLVPGGSCTRNAREFSSWITSSRQPGFAIVLGLDVRQPRDRLHRCLPPGLRERLGVVENPFVRGLSRQQGRNDKQRVPPAFARWSSAIPSCSEEAHSRCARLAPAWQSVGRPRQSVAAQGCVRLDEVRLVVLARLLAVPCVVRRSPEVDAAMTAIAKKTAGWRRTMR